NCYRRVLAGERVAIEDEDRRAAQEMLRLAGMVKFEGGAVTSRNAIFTRRYDRDWVRDRLDSPIYATLGTRWQIEGRDPTLLLPGRALRAATEWLADQSSIPPHVAEFIHASEQTDSHDRRSSRSRLTRQIVVNLLATAALVVAVIAWRQRAAAERAADEAAR